MKRFCLASVLVLGTVFGSVMPVTAEEGQKRPTTEHPYGAFAQRMDTRLRFVTDFSFPGGPAFQIKVYDWVIGPRQEFSNFPLEGSATIEVKAGEAETTIDGVTMRRREGDYWVVPEGKSLSIRLRPETVRGDNVVSLHGVVIIRK